MTLYNWLQAPQCDEEYWPSALINERSLCVPVSIVCETTASAGEQSGHVSVQVKGGGIGQSAQRFRYQVTINPTATKGIKMV